MTSLSSLEEALFTTWARAHQVENHDDPKNQFDFRGLYKQSNGQILPPGFLRNLASQHNAAMEPQEGGDMPDPFAAQAEMHKANLDSQSKQQADQMKFHLENAKMQHKSSENAMDREHDLRKHLVAQQLKQQQAHEQMQQKQQLADRQMTQQQQMGQQEMAQKAQLQQTQLGHQAEQADKDRKAMPSPTATGVSI